MQNTQKHKHVQLLYNAIDNGEYIRTASEVNAREIRTRPQSIQRRRRRRRCRKRYHIVLGTGCRFSSVVFLFIFVVFAFIICSSDRYVLFTWATVNDSHS